MNEDVAGRSRGRNHRVREKTSKQAKRNVGESKMREQKNAILI